MDTMQQKQLQELQSRKAKALMELGKLMYNQIRAGQATQSEAAAYSKEIMACDSEIAQIKDIITPAAGSGICPACKGAVDSDDLFCPSCGFSVQGFYEQGVKACKSCGKSITAEANWCPVCGYQQL